MTGTFTTRDGLTLSYERRGSGPLLVWHPGGPGGSAAELLDFAGLDDTFELVLWGNEEESVLARAIETRSGEPWFPEAQQAIEEQAGAFASIEELVANVRRQQPEAFRAALAGFLL